MPEKKAEKKASPKSGCPGKCATPKSKFEKTVDAATIVGGGRDYSIIVLRMDEETLETKVEEIISGIVTKQKAILKLRKVRFERNIPV
jgi:hypothetical protein